MHLFTTLFSCCPPRPLPPHTHRKERQLHDIMNKFKRHSVSGQLPLHLDQPLFDVESTDTTEDEADNGPHSLHTRVHTSPSRYTTGAKMERAISFDVSTPRVRKRLWRRKRRMSNTKDEVGPTTLDPDMMDSKQALLQPTASPPHSPQASHPRLLWRQTTPPREDLVDHPTSGESTPRPLQGHDPPITDEGDFSPAVAQFLESVKHVHSHPHNVRRSSSNGSLKTHRRQGSNGSTQSYHMTSLSASPIKEPSQCNSTSSLTKSRRAHMEHTSSRRASGSGIQYTKLDSSSSGEDDKEHETGTQSSDHNTTSDGQPFFSRSNATKTQVSEAHCLRSQTSHCSGRDVYSNESSCDTRVSDGGHDADGESDFNSLDPLSELEPNETNESNLESLHSPSNVEESSDITSTTPDIPGDSDYPSSSLIPKQIPTAPHSPGQNVSMLITQFETSSPDLSLLGSDHQTALPEVPAHIKRDVAIPRAGSYSPKAVEDLLEGGWSSLVC